MDILLIDGYIQSRDLLEGFLRRLGHDVVTCRDAEAGLTAYKTKSFPVVICDLVMPGMTGIDFLKAIAGLLHREHSCVLLMTGRADIESAIAALALGAYDYLVKPVILNELAAILERISALKQTEAALAGNQAKRTASETRFRGVFDHMMNSYSLCKVIVGDDDEPVDLEYVEVNPAFEKQFGFKAAEVVGKRVTEVFPSIKKEDADLLKVLFDVAQTGRPVSQEQYSQNSEKFYQVSAYSPEPGLVVMIAQDISDTKHYKSLVAEMPDGFAYCKMIYENGEPDDLVYLTVNAAFTKLTGLQDVVGKRITEVLPGIKASNPELLQIYGRVARTGRSERIERYYEPLKAWLSIAVSSRGDGHFMLIFDNVTERKLMEETLQASELKYRLLFDNVNDAIFLTAIVDDETFGQIKEVNDTACRRLGYSREELVGMTLRKIDPNLSIEEWNILKAQIKKQGEYLCERIHRAKNGDLIPVEIYIKQIELDGKGYNLAVARDLTERKHSEKLLRTSYERMRRDHLLNELLKAESCSEQKVYETLLTAGLKTAGSLTCYCLVIHEWKGKLREYWKQYLEELHYLLDSVVDTLSVDGRCLVWRSDEGVGLLHSGTLGSGDTKKYQEELAAQVKEKVEGIFPELTVVIGIAESTVKVTDFRTRYRQSCIAVTTGRKVWPGRKIYHYLDMGIFQVLPTILDQDAAAAFIERNLGKLIRYDAERKAELLATLEAILENNHLKTAAEKLFVHLKTIEFRKKRIEEILGVSLVPVETRMTLAMAVRLLKIGGEGYWDAASPIYVRVDNRSN
jgi:PAS domain S-box-containing protein